MPTLSLKSDHVNVLCSDGIVRRFYITNTLLDREDVTGFVIYKGEQHPGYADRNPHTGKSEFVPQYLTCPIRQKDTEVWQPSPNCSAKNYCIKCKRCVGGCKK